MKTLLSPKDVAQAIGVSESSLKRWTDEGLLMSTRTAGGHRRIAQGEAVRFVRARRTPVIRPELLGLAEVGLGRHAAPQACKGGRLGESLLHVLKRGNGPAARGLLVNAYLDGQELEALCDGPIRFAMTELGELWRHSEQGIFIEHRATDICVQALSRLRHLVDSSSQIVAPSLPGKASGNRKRSAVAVGGGPAGDPYLLPSMMAATVLAGVGFDAINLGPDTPVAVLIDAAKHDHSQLVWVTFSAHREGREIDCLVNELAEGIEPLGAQLIVGGRAVPARWRASLPHVHSAGGMTELAAFARGMLARAS